MVSVLQGFRQRLSRARDPLLQEPTANNAENGQLPVVDFTTVASQYSDDAESPEEAACLFRRMLFFWVFPLVWSGYRRGRTDLEDLPPVPSGERPRPVAELTRSSLHKREADNELRKERLWRLMWRITGGIFLDACVWHVCRMCMSYLQPYFLAKLLTCLRPDSGDRSLIVLYAVGIALSVMGNWILAEYAFIVFFRADTKAQNALNHIVYRKSLLMPTGAAGYTLGALQTHFASDSTKPTQIFYHYCFAGIAEAMVTTCVVAWNMTDQIGQAGAVGMLVIFALVPIQFFNSKRTKRMSIEIQKCRDERGRLCNQFLSAMRIVKCFRLEKLALAMIDQVREKELDAQWRRRRIFPINNFLGSTTGLLGTVAAFAWYELVMDRPLTPVKAFVVLSYATMLKSSMFGVPNFITSILEMLVSFSRIETLIDVPCETEVWMPRPLGETDTRSVGEPYHTSTKEPDFVMEDVSFGWPAQGEIPHRGIVDLSLTVQPGELLFVCGPIGCGKSVLLEGLSGILKPWSGSLSRRSGTRLAYVAQRPWLLNETLLENIIFGRPLNETFLGRILDCCALRDDLQALPDGLATQVGEEGVQLSGGQKQRVSLARAMYSEADVILLDDVMSALDAHVGKHVWETAILSELQGRTRILVTHQVHLCSHPSVDRILMLGTDGRPEFCGPFRDLKGARGMDVFNAACKDPATKTNGSDDQASSKPSSYSIASPSSSPNMGRAGGGEYRRVGAVLGEDLCAYIRACGGSSGTLFIAILICCYYGLQFASSLVLAAWTTRNNKEEDPSHPEARDDSRANVIRYLVICLLTGFSCFAFFMGIQLVAMRAARKLHAELMQGLIHTELRFFDITPTGRVLNRCLKDMSTIDDRMPAVFREIFQSICDVGISVVLLVLFAWEALVFLPPFVLIYWKIMSVYRWPARDLKRLEGVSRSPGMSHFSDTIRGTSTIRAYGHESRFLQRNLELLGGTQRTIYWFWVLQGWVSTSQEVLGTFFLGILAVVVGYRASTGSLGSGYAGLALTYAISMPRDLMWLSRRLANVEVEFVSIERVMEYVRLAREAIADDVQGACAKIADSQQYALVAQSIRLRYGPNGPWILDGLSLRIPMGCRCAVVGRTGCGKSSLLSALVRLYPIGGGNLHVHGRDSIEVSISSLRNTVRVLLQDPVLFSGTVKSNLLCCKPTDGVESQSPTLDSTLWAALRSAGVERRVRGLSKGLDSRVEEAGHNFSQGERQLLCLARILVNAGDPAANAGLFDAPREDDAALGPRILLCDEPTSACDHATDEVIHNTLLRGLPADWTLIVVCHRLRRVREFDKVFVIDAGRLAQEGSPAMLLDSQTEGGVFVEMCKEQCVQ